MAPPRPPSSWTSSFVTSSGRPVTDLTKEDFELYEDAVPQTVGSFSVVSRASGIGIQVRRRAPGTTIVSTAGATAEATESKTDEKPPTTAIVFDSLTPEALRMAQTASLAELPMNGRSPGRIGVFTAEPGSGSCSPTPRSRAGTVRRPSSLRNRRRARRGGE